MVGFLTDVELAQSYKTSPSWGSVLRCAINSVSNMDTPYLRKSRDVAWNEEKTWRKMRVRVMS